MNKARLVQHGDKQVKNAEGGGGISEKSPGEIWGMGRMFAGVVKYVALSLFSAPFCCVLGRV